MKTLNTTKRNSTSKYAEDFFETQDKTIDVLCKEYLTYNFGVVYSNGESYNEN